jgi:antitoxin (DNA-binding transcriptional repressor) of toxin-antitoxin stability system
MWKRCLTVVGGPRESEVVRRQITPEELAANMSDAIKHVKDGEVLTIVEGGDPIATVTPADESSWLIRHDPALRLSDFKPGAPLKVGGLDAVEMLIAEREYERSGKKYGR